MGPVCSWIRTGCMDAHLGKRTMMHKLTTFLQMFTVMICYCPIPPTVRSLNLMLLLHTCLSTLEPFGWAGIGLNYDLSLNYTLMEPGFGLILACSLPKLGPNMFQWCWCRFAAYLIKFLCRWIYSSEAVPDTLWVDPDLPQHKQQVQRQVLPESGPCGRGRSEVLQAARDHNVPPPRITPGLLDPNL